VFAFEYVNYSLLLFVQPRDLLLHADDITYLFTFVDVRQTFYLVFYQVHWVGF